MSVFENQPTGQEIKPADQLTDRELILQMVQDQAQHRAEIAALRDELAKQKGQQISQPQQFLSAEQLLELRMAEVSKHPYYCPGCGELYNYQTKCVGSLEKPHPAIEVVSTDELHSGDTSKHTPAPAS